jgi:hypothetical protein
VRARLPASERTSQRIEQVINALEHSEENATFSKLAMRRVIEELLEAEVADRLGRGFYERATGECDGHRNGYRTGRLKTAEGAVEYSVPQVRGLSEPFRSQIRPELGQWTEALEDLAVEMYARRLSTRDIEATVCDEHERSLLSRTAVSQVTERLWAEYEAFASRDLSEYDVAYLFSDGIAERLHGGQRREAVLCALGHQRRGAEGAAAPLAQDQGKHRELPSVLPGHEALGSTRPAAGRDRWRPGADPCRGGTFSSLGARSVSGAPDAEPAEQGAGCGVAGVPGAGEGVLVSPTLVQRDASSDPDDQFNWSGCSVRSADG